MGKLSLREEEWLGRRWRRGDCSPSPLTPSLGPGPKDPWGALGGENHDPQAAARGQLEGKGRPWKSQGGNRAFRESAS